MDISQKILEFVKEKGVVSVNEVSKAMGLDTFIASAVLRNLVSTGKIKATETLISSYPLYYFPGREEEVRRRLEEYFLNLLEGGESFHSKISKEVLDKAKLIKKIKSEKVLIENELNNYERLVLSELRDLVRSFKVRIFDKEVMVWCYYTVGLDEIKNIIKRKVEELNIIKKGDIVMEIEKNVLMELSSAGKIKSIKKVSEGVYEFAIVHEIFKIPIEFRVFYIKGDLDEDKALAIVSFVKDLNIPTIVIYSGEGKDEALKTLDNYNIKHRKLM